MWPHHNCSDDNFPTRLEVDSDKPVNSEFICAQSNLELGPMTWTFNSNSVICPSKSYAHENFVITLSPKMNWVLDLGLGLGLENNLAGDTAPVLTHCDWPGCRGCSENRKIVQCGGKLQNIEQLFSAIQTIYNRWNCWIRCCTHKGGILSKEMISFTQQHNLLFCSDDSRTTGGAAGDQTQQNL